jgi:hypothetical protein
MTIPSNTSQWCPRCATLLAPGIALGYIGAPTGPVVQGVAWHEPVGVFVACLKCPDCGHSVSDPAITDTNPTICV